LPIQIFFPQVKYGAKCTKGIMFWMPGCVKKCEPTSASLHWTGCSTASDGSGGVPWLGDLCPGGFQGSKHNGLTTCFSSQRKKSLAAATPRKAYTQMTGVCRLVKAL